MCMKENLIHSRTCVYNINYHVVWSVKYRRNCIHDYLHKVTRAVVNYCKANDIHTVIIGDITNIRRNKNLGKVTNQKLHAPQVTKEYAKKCNRTNRGLYKDQMSVYNADAVGAFNILRKYLSVSGKQKELSVTGLKNPEIIKVAV